MSIGDPAVYMTTDGRIHIPKKPGRLQRLKLFLGRKFGIKRWQPKGPFVGLAVSDSDSEGWVTVAIGPPTVKETKELSE